MPDHRVHTLARGEVKRLTLTSETITTYSLYNDGDYSFRILAGTEGSPPVAADFAKGWVYKPGFGDDDKTLGGMFPGIVGANVLYAYAEKPTRVIFSYA